MTRTVNQWAADRRLTHHPLRAQTSHRISRQPEPGQHLVGVFTQHGRGPVQHRRRGAQAQRAGYAGYGFNVALLCGRRAQRLANPQGTRQHLRVGKSPQPLTGSFGRAKRP